ncbi:MAG: GrpB family protein [Anaerolineales bacterium]|nr:GrpB family protein [Anaerolineales bacterium]
MIVIHEYNPNWPVEFESIRTNLSLILGTLALRIDHIGSTSVPGLGAKDVIDIQITVRELSPGIIAKMVEAGYVQSEHTRDHVPLGEEDDPRLWEKFLFTEPKGQRREHIHVRAEGKPNQKYPLLFRDYLRSHPKSSMSIELIKREIAKRHSDDVEAYYDIKDPVYDLIWDAALDWAKYTNWRPG